MSTYPVADTNFTSSPSVTAGSNPSNLLYFTATDQSFILGLWVTDGTQTGTHEILPIAGANQSGVNPQYLAVLNGSILFEGVNASGVRGLWTTDGTSAGTVELTGIAGANPQGLGPGYMQVYNGKVLFRGEAGVAGNNVPGLWITDGTAAGTVELGGAANAAIVGAYRNGFLPTNPDFTPFKGKVLFQAEDTNAQIGLWVTDGTVAGTQELAPIAGAAFGPSGAHVGYDIQPRYMTVLGNLVVFAGADQQDTPGSLWVTDGTAAGTFELGGRGNAAVAGSPNGFSGQFTSELPLGIQPNGLTTFNNKVIFAGFDNTLRPNGYYADTDALWITDGTAAGTVEVGGAGNAAIQGANPAASGGIFWYGSIQYPDFTVYNNKVLFVGYDASNHLGLWVTDGTAAGTTEVGGLSNAGISGAPTFSGSVSPDFTLYNGKVYFSDLNGLWVTDGTASGTHQVAAFPSSGVANLTVLGPTPLTTQIFATSDNGSSNLNAGHLVSVVLTGSAALTVTGAPSLQLNDNETAIYSSGSGTNTLTFTYMVQPGDSTPDLQVTGLNLPGGASIVDATGASPSATISQDLAIKIDTSTSSATSVQQEVMGLYGALYGRAGEFPAYSFWVGYAGPGLNTGNAGSTAVTLAQATTLGQGFVNSQNTFFNQTYGALTDSQFINAMYLNIGGAAGDPNGIGYWSGLLAQAEAQGQSVQAARAGLVGQFVQVLVGFDTSHRLAGLTDQQWADALTRTETISNKIAVSLAYANASNGTGGSILIPATVGDAAYNAAIKVLQGVTADPHTVAIALAGISNAVSHHDLSLI